MSLERNTRVAARYDELIHAGKHGHYETLFQVVREEVELAAPPKPDHMKARLIWRYRPPTRYRLFSRGPNHFCIWIRPVALHVWWPTFWTCLGRHKWKGDISSCCPQCGRRPSAKVFG